ncbi:hypothetical protein B0H14DRAFT_2386233, partial [Mycena olivaceomarginata]
QIFFSEARLIHVKRCFDEIFDAMHNPRGVHPSMGKIFEGVAGKIETVGGDIGKNKRRRTNPRTWKEHNGNTMYLD